MPPSNTEDDLVLSVECALLAARRINSLSTGRSKPAARFTSSHCVLAGNGIPSCFSSCCRRLNGMPSDRTVEPWRFARAAAVPKRLLDGRTVNRTRAARLRDREFPLTTRSASRSQQSQLDMLPCLNVVAFGQYGPFPPTKRLCVLTRRTERIRSRSYLPRLTGQCMLADGGSGWRGGDSIFFSSRDFGKGKAPLRVRIL
jgi:hypothetical protein